ncbi:AGE family epimerase/isomerase [Pelagibius sp.]|uniref:AGE family epimerase/isomerase n=1 Tax=Pelagibius sp. TaxID=1931238 RepID=UPI002629BD05|nr:AGE family epimerase/isomerase [Pelagibius sp.]
MSQNPPPTAGPITAPRLRDWLAGTVLPFWETTGFDSRHGAFFEKLDLDGTVSSEDYTRLRVQARQIYVYAHAGVLGLSTDGLARAHDAFDFLRRHAWDAQHGGWFHRLRRDGQPLDRTRDFYDHAFMLLALAWLYRASGEGEVLQAVRKTTAFLDENLRLERGGTFDGYAEQRGEEASQMPTRRRQNPHMHLFEALLALHEATGDAEWIERAASIRGLFDAHFFSAENGQLAEFFDADWREMPVDGRFIREPGHHFEWVWLLHRYGQLSGDDGVLPAMEGLFGWAWAQGIDRRAEGIFGAYDAVDPEGQVLQGGSKRLWPQTEALKACLALAERSGHPAAAAGIAPLLQSFFTHFVGLDHALWQDQFDGAGAMIAKAVPASSLYHLFLAIAEVLRVWPSLPAQRGAP